MSNVSSVLTSSSNDASSQIELQSYFDVVPDHTGFNIFNEFDQQQGTTANQAETRKVHRICNLLHRLLSCRKKDSEFLLG